MNEQNQKENQAEKLTDFGFSKVKETDKEKQVKAVFDQVAPKYDLMNDVLSFGMHRLGSSMRLIARKLDRDEGFGYRRRHR